MKIHYKKIYFLVAAILFSLSIKAQTSVFTPANVSSVTCSAPIVYGTISRWYDGNTTIDADATFPASDSILVTFKLKQAFKVISYKLDFYYSSFSYTSKSIRLSGSNDGVTWKSLDNKTVNAYPFLSSFSNNTSYTYYQFSFKGHINNELWLNEITGYNDQLSPPVLTATPGVTGNIANLSWNQSIIGTGNNYAYELERSADGTNFSPVAAINAPNTTYTDTTLTQSTAYYYRIRARKDTAFSAYSSVVKVTTISDALTTAPVLTATPRSGYNIGLSWNAIVKTKGSYEVSRSVNNHEFTVLKTLDKAVTTYIDVMADTTVTYWYKVRGINYTSNSPYSNTVEVTDSLKKQPTLTAIPGTVGTQANLSWSLAINTAGSFALERSTDGTHFTPLKTFDKSITTYTDATLTNATAYWYQVKGVNYAGSSPYSAIVKVTTLNDTLKNTPVLTATATTGTRTQLSWSLVFNTPRQAVLSLNNQPMVPTLPCSENLIRP